MSPVESILADVRLLAAVSAGGVLGSLQLARSGARTMAVLNVAASVLAGFGAASCGMALAQAIQ